MRRLLLATILGLTALIATPAAAQDSLYVGTEVPPTSVLSATAERAASDPAAVAAATAAQPQALAFTGGDVTGLVIIGLALIGAGALIVSRRRLAS